MLRLLGPCIAALDERVALLAVLGLACLGASLFGLVRGYAATQASPYNDPRRLPRRDNTAAQVGGYLVMGFSLLLGGAGVALLLETGRRPRVAVEPRQDEPLDGRVETAHEPSTSAKDEVASGAAAAPTSVAAASSEVSGSLAGPPRPTSTRASSGAAAPIRSDVRSIGESSAASVGGLGPALPLRSTAPMGAKNVDPVTQPTAELARAVLALRADGKDLAGAHRVEDSPLFLGHSWMVQLLPFLGHGALYDRVDPKKPWTDDEHRAIASTIIGGLLDPADRRTTWEGYPFDGAALTHFVGMSGVEDGRNVVAAALPRSDPRAGIFGYERVASDPEITDGTSQTIMLIGSGRLAGPWMQAGGATIRGARAPYFDEVTGFGSASMGRAGAVAAMADGSVRTLSADIDPHVFQALCTMHAHDEASMSDER